MSTPKLNKMTAIIKLEDAIYKMMSIGFSTKEIRDIVRYITKGKRRLGDPNENS